MKQKIKKRKIIFNLKNGKNIWKWKLRNNRGVIEDFKGN